MVCPGRPGPVQGTESYALAHPEKSPGEKGSPSDMALGHQAEVGPKAEVFRLGHYLGARTWLGPRPLLGGDGAFMRPLFSLPAPSGFMFLVNTLMMGVNANWYEVFFLNQVAASSMHLP